MSVDQGLSCAAVLTSLGVSAGVNHNLPKIDKAKKSIAYIDVNKPVLG